MSHTPSKVCIHFTNADIEHGAVARVVIIVGVRVSSRANLALVSGARLQRLGGETPSGGILIPL